MRAGGGGASAIFPSMCDCACISYGVGVKIGWLVLGILHRVVVCGYFPGWRGEG